MPTDCTADPNADGTITVRWKGPLANQTFFTVWRRAYSGPTPPLNALPFTQLAAIAARGFIDSSVPTGVSTVEYQVRAQRGTAASAPAIATALFGSTAQGGGGGLSLAA